MGEQNPNWAGRFNLKTLDEVQSIEVDPVTKERRHKDHPEIWELPKNDAQTILEGFERGLKVAGENGQFIGKPIGDPVTGYDWKSYGDVQKESKQCAKALSTLGLESGKDFIGFFSTNCYEYDVGILAGYYINLANVSLYDTLGLEAVGHICSQTSLKMAFCQDIPKLKLLLESAPDIKNVVMLEPTKGELPSKEGVKIHSWVDFLASGGDGELKEVRPTADDLATLNYTSGTTGLPKGVELSHRAMMTCGIGVGKFMMVKAAPTTDDRWFSYLPLAHIFERAAHIAFMSFGSQWCYVANIKNVVGELAIAQPTIFGSVPRVLNRLYDVINDALNAPGCVPYIKSSLVKLAMRKKRALLNQGIVRRDTFWDKILAPIQGKLGGRVHTIVCGAAPLNPEVRGFVREATGAYFIEGYGQTENCAAGCGTVFSNYCVEDGSVGVPTPWTGIKLVDVPEMNYYAKDDKGEICFRGGNLMNGYFQMPEKTAETIDEDGWLHTGDIGTWLENGCLKIIDRKKNIFKLSHGEYVAPERLEGIYAKNALVTQIFIHGDSNESTLVAVIVPNDAEFEKLGKDKNQMMKNLNDTAKEHDKLKGFEMIRAIHIETDPFTPENGLLTPTQKAKRPQLLAKYKSEIAQLYAAMKK